MRPLIFLSFLPLAVAGCASSGGAADSAASCQGLVGRYADAGEPQVRDLADPTGRGPRSESLVELVDADLAELGIPAEDRVLVVRHVGTGYGLGIERRDAPPTDTAVWEILARCDGGELRFETKASYRSADGSHVTRQQIRLVAYGDEDGTLIVERAFRQRALGLVDVRRGGQREQYFRFAPLD